jgi:hypothetical protein
MGEVEIFWDPVALPGPPYRYRLIVPAVAPEACAQDATSHCGDLSVAGHLAAGLALVLELDSSTGFASNNHCTFFGIVHTNSCVWACTQVAQSMRRTLALSVFFAPL